MATTLAIRMRNEALRSLSFAAISSTYAGVGSSLANPARIIHILNTTDATLIFSFDGVVDAFALPANGFLLLDITSNQSVSQGFFLAQGDRLYVRQETATPTSGNVYFAVFYGSF